MSRIAEDFQAALFDSDDLQCHFHVPIGFLPDLTQRRGSPAFWLVSSSLDAV